MLLPRSCRIRADRSRGSHGALLANQAAGGEVTIVFVASRSLVGPCHRRASIIRPAAAAWVISLIWRQILAKGLFGRERDGGCPDWVPPQVCASFAVRIETYCRSMIIKNRNFENALFETVSQKCSKHLRRVSYLQMQEPGGAVAPHAVSYEGVAGRRRPCADLDEVENRERPTGLLARHRPLWPKVVREEPGPDQLADLALALRRHPNRTSPLFPAMSGSRHASPQTG